MIVKQTMIEHFLAADFAPGRGCQPYGQCPGVPTGRASVSVYSWPCLTFAVGGSGGSFCTSIYVSRFACSTCYGPRRLVFVAWSLVAWLLCCLVPCLPRVCCLMLCCFPASLPCIWFSSTLAASGFHSSVVASIFCCLMLCGLMCCRLVFCSRPLFFIESLLWMPWLLIFQPCCRKGHCIRVAGSGCRMGSEDGLCGLLSKFHASSCAACP